MDQAQVVININRDEVAGIVKRYLARRFDDKHFQVQSGYTDLRHVVVFGYVESAALQEMHVYAGGVKNVLERVLQQAIFGCRCVMFVVKGVSKISSLGKITLFFFFE